VGETEPPAIGPGHEQEVGFRAGAVLIGKRLHRGFVRGHARIRQVRAKDRQLRDQATLAGGELTAPFEQAIEGLFRRVLIFVRAFHRAGRDDAIGRHEHGHHCGSGHQGDEQQQPRLEPRTPGR
jgi:hypothetical protein